jgi:hypothetical protein
MGLAWRVSSQQVSYIKAVPLGNRVFSPSHYRFLLLWETINHYYGVEEATLSNVGGS